jgi:hypothetical protein
MSEQSSNTIPDDEISIKDTIDFSAESWSTVILMSLFWGLY